MSGWSRDRRRSLRAAVLFSEPQETEEVCPQRLNELQWDEQTVVSSRSRRAHRFNLRDAVTARRSDVIYVNVTPRRPPGNTGMRPRAGGGGFSSISSTVKSPQWNPRVCLTIQAFNRVRSASASSHTHTSSWYGRLHGRTTELVRGIQELRWINRALEPPSRSTYVTFSCGSR